MPLTKRSVSAALPAGIAGLLLLLLLAWLVAAAQLKMWTAAGQPGPGFWPALLAALGVIMLAVIVSQEVRKLRTRRPTVEPLEEAIPYTDPEAVLGDGSVHEDHGKGVLLRPLGILAGLIAFILLMPILGFQIGLAAFLIYTCLVLIRMGILQTLILVAVLSAIVYFVFGMFFAVPFPTGILGV